MAVLSKKRERESLSVCVSVWVCMLAWCQPSEALSAEIARLDPGLLASGSMLSAAGDSGGVTLARRVSLGFKRERCSRFPPKAPSPSLRHQPKPAHRYGAIQYTMEPLSC